MKYKVGDVVLYEPAEEVLLIGSKRFGWCHGDFFPHRRYSGSLFRLNKDGNVLVPSGEFSTSVTNVRQRDLSVLNVSNIDLSCLVGHAL